MSLKIQDFLDKGFIQHKTDMSHEYADCLLQKWIYDKTIIKNIPLMCIFIRN